MSNRGMKKFWTIIHLLDSDIYFPKILEIMFHGTIPFDLVYDILAHRIRNLVEQGRIGFVRILMRRSLLPLNQPV